jgi:hypothetical protein
MTEHENNDSTEPVVHNHDDLVVEGLRKEIEMLTTKLENQKISFLSWRDKAFALEQKIKEGREILSEAIEEGDVSADDDFVTSLADHFDWSLTKEFEVKVVVTFTGTLTAPLGSKFEDFNDRGFDADLTLDNYTNTDWEWEQNDSEMEIEEN